MTNNSNKKKSKLMLCVPAIVYLVFGIISIIMSIVEKESIGSISISAIFIALWTYILNLICSAGYEVISWILVFLPIVIFIILMIMGLSFLGGLMGSAMQNNNNDN